MVRGGLVLPRNKDARTYAWGSSGRFAFREIIRDFQSEFFRWFRPVLTQHDAFAIRENA